MTTMKTENILLLLVSVAWPLAAMAQTKDTTVVERTVTVEREFQPIIQHAGKLNVSPERLDVAPEPAQVEYSMYASPLKTSFNINPLTCSLTTFEQPKHTHNVLEGSLGHPLSRFNFYYRLTPRRNTTLNFFARHDGQWGRRTWTNTIVGLDLVQQYQNMELYFLADGKNRFYTLYGRYYDGDNGLTIARFSEFRNIDKQNIWEVNTKVGLRSRKGSTWQYRVETGYNAFITPHVATEHIVRTYADLTYMGEVHHGGIHLFVQNAMYSVDPSQQLADSLYNARHGIRLEPFYELVLDKVRLHAGVNLDLNIGKGQMMSSAKNVSFAPSPNVKVEYRILPEWLALYAGAAGRFNFGTLEGYMNMCPYLDIIPGVTSHHVSGYVPVDASLGFLARPAKTLLIDLYAHYAIYKNAATFLQPSMSELIPQNTTYLDYLYSDWQQWKIGAEITYHYQDIIHILLAGNYYVWKQDRVELFPGPKYQVLHPVEGRAYDRPSWDLHLRIDARINSKWSLYSDNTFAGGRWALTTGEDVWLKPTIDLQLGAQYEVNTWLSCYLQLGNLLNRHNDIFYGYQSQGITGQVGAKWKF